MVKTDCPEARELCKAGTVAQDEEPSKVLDLGIRSLSSGKTVRHRRFCAGSVSAVCGAPFPCPITDSAVLSTILPAYHLPALSRMARNRK